MTNGGEQVVGAVLSDRDIQGLSAGDTPLIDPLEPDCLKGAAYDLRVGTDGIVLPDGTTVPPAEGELDRPILLQPGETVLVTTLERLRLPANLVGNMSIKADLARRGILALTGLIVDPGYGLHEGDGRLHFPLANLGDAPVALIPEETRLASIQFVRLTQPAERDRPASAFAGIWEGAGGPPGSLGFVDDLRELEESTEGLEAKVERQARATDYLIAGGIFLLAITVLGIAISGILSLGSDSKVVDAADAVIPNNREGQVLGICGLFGLAAIAMGISSGIAIRTSSPPRMAIESPRYARSEAWRLLRAEQGARRMVFLLGCVALGFLTAGAVADLDVSLWVAVPAAIVILCAAGVLLRGHLIEPISPQAIDERVRTWMDGG